MTHKVYPAFISLSSNSVRVCRPSVIQCLYIFRFHAKCWLFRTFRALRAIWRSFLPRDALSKRAKKTQSIPTAWLSTESAEEPKCCVMVYNRKAWIPGLDWVQHLLYIVRTTFGMASLFLLALTVNTLYFRCHWLPSANKKIAVNLLKPSEYLSRLLGITPVLKTASYWSEPFLPVHPP